MLSLQLITSLGDVDEKYLDTYLASLSIDKINIISKCIQRRIENEPRVIYVVQNTQIKYYLYNSS